MVTAYPLGGKGLVTSDVFFCAAREKSAQLCAKRYYSYLHITNHRGSDLHINKMPLQRGYGHMTFAGLRLKVYGVMALTLLVAACSGAEDGDQEAVYKAPRYQAPTVDEQQVNQRDAESAEPGSQRDLELTAGRRVFFGYDHYDLTDQAQRTLRSQAAWLKKYPQKNIIVEGHCDERGTREYNLALGARRAAAAQRYLIVLGVDASRIRTISYGKERPEVAASNDSSWARNRRAVTLVE